MEFLRNILTIISPLFVLALALVALVWLRREKQRTAANGEAETASKALFLERAEAWLLGALPALITKAENDWFTLGAKTGPIKLSAVKAELLKIAPPELIAVISEVALDNLIDKALDEARETWDELPDLLVENLITGGAEGEAGVAITVDVEILDEGGDILEEGEVLGDAVEVDVKIDLSDEGPIVVVPPMRRKRLIAAVEPVDGDEGDSIPAAEGAQDEAAGDEGSGTGGEAE